MDKEKLTVIHSVLRWLPQTEAWLYDQVRSLPPEIESHIVCESTSNLDQFPMPNIHSLLDASRWRSFWDSALRKLGMRNHLGLLVAQARRQHARVLHSHFGHVGWANLKAAKRAGLRHVITFYGFDVNYLTQLDSRWHDRYRSLFEQVDRVLCEGPNMRLSLVALGCPQEKVQLHHLGVMTDEIPFRPRTWSSSEPLRVLIAASFQEKKGIPYALEALAKLQHEVPLVITVVGDANSEQRSQAEKLKILSTISKHNLVPKIRMLGYQSHRALLEEAYKHHIFLSPSVTASDGDSEGGAPVTIIEMAATGMPVVSTAHCDIPEVIHHGSTGLLAEERDVQGLVSHLKWLMDHPDHWLSMLKAARRHLEAEYDAPKQGKRLEEIYWEIAAS